MNNATKFLDNIFLYVFLALVIAGLISLLADLSWKGFFICLIISELIGLSIYGFFQFNKPKDNKIKYHSIKECRNYCINWLLVNNFVKVVPFTSIADSEEGISGYGLPFKRDGVSADNSQIYFACFISTDRFPKYFYIALNTEIVDNDSTFSDKFECNVFPQNISSDRLDSLRQRMCNLKSDVPIITKSQGYSQRIDPSGTITTNKNETTNADDEFEDKEGKDVKK